MRPFRIEVPEADLVDLRDRLARTRWPEPATVGGWTQGVPLDYARDLCEYWRRRYDWRRCEAELNALPQFRTTLDGGGDDGVDVHFLHVRSPHDDALPLLLTHGWPGSVVEFLDVVGALTDPPDPADAFHLVIPSLPGYGFSSKPAVAGWGVERIAVAWAQLMDRLDYDRYGAQGGDWGSVVTAALGSAIPEALVGIHLTMPLALRPDRDDRPLSAFDKAALSDRKAFRKVGTGYAAEQATRPQTLGYGLVDSPAALCSVDRGEVLGLVGVCGRPVERRPPRPPPRRRDALLAPGHRCVVDPPLLGELPAASGGPGRGADRRHPVPGRAAAGAAAVGGGAVHRSAVLVGAEGGRPLRLAGAARDLRRRGAGLLPAGATGNRQARRPATSSGLGWRGFA